MNIDSRGLFYGGIFLLIVGFTLYSFIHWIIVSEPTRKFCAFIKVYNYESKSWEEQYGQALIKGDKKLVGFLAIDGILHGTEDFNDSYNVYMIQPNDNRSMTDIRLKDGEQFKIGLIQFGNCTNDVVKHWQQN